MPYFPPRQIVALIIFLLFALLLQILKQNYNLDVKDFIWSSHNANDTKLSYDVVIGILSARDHFELRHALRETWVGHIKQDKELNAKVLVKFIVGDKPCTIPPQDRLDQYSCQKSGLVNPVLNEEILAYKVPHGTSGGHIHSGPLGMDFKVNFPIVIKQLGVFDSNSDGLKTKLVVRLYDRATGTEIVNATFTPSSPGELIGGSRFRQVVEYILPKEFEASIVAENFNKADPSNNKPMEHGTTDSGGGLITFRRVSRFGMVKGTFPDNQETALEEPNQYAAGNFIYYAYVSDQGDLSKEGLMKNKQEHTARQKEWMQSKKEEDEKLQEEISTYNDILLVDAVEVYRNLPKKMLQFYSWVNHHVDFNFTFKTDDDCFVNINSILKDLIRYKLHDKTKVWWSGFRFEWPVERFGKWREPDYSASIYPKFACGAGYMMSADLVRWLARNSNDLKEYQGEDISLGIWLASVGPMFVTDYRWACAKHCWRHMYTSPENAPNELRGLWTNLTHCGDPCGCS